MIRVNRSQQVENHQVEPATGATGAAEFTACHQVAASSAALNWTKWLKPALGSHDVSVGWFQGGHWDGSEGWLLLVVNGGGLW